MHGEVRAQGTPKVIVVVFWGVLGPGGGQHGGGRDRAVLVVKRPRSQQHEENQAFFVPILNVLLI